MSAAVKTQSRMLSKATSQYIQQNPGWSTPGNELHYDLKHRPFGIPSILSLTNAQILGAVLFMEDALQRMRDYVETSGISLDEEAVVSSHFTWELNETGIGCNVRIRYRFFELKDEIYLSDPDIIP